jgi:hypothetical protein
VAPALAWPGPRLRAVRCQRGKDGRIGRLLGTWRRAGVRAHGARPHPEPGVGPGGGLSVGLAPICLQPGLAAGCEREVQPRLKGRSVLPRLAADGVSGGARAADAQKRRGVVPKRLTRCGRRMPPTQTPLVVGRKPKARQASAHGHGTGEFLGVTQYGARPRRGGGGIKRRKAWWPWWRHHRHGPVHDQYRRLCVKRRGP